MAVMVKNSGRPDSYKLDILNYGLPDTGKTFNIGRLKNMGFNPLVIACDPGGMTTLQEYNVDFVEIDKTKTAFELIGDIYRGSFNIRQYDMICIDGASNFSYMCLKETGENSKDRRLDYAMGNIDFRRLIDDVRRLPVHVFINAFETEIKANGSIQYGAGCEGAKFSIQFTGLMNTVIRSFRYLDNDTKMYKYALQTKHDGMHIARERSSRCNQYEHCIEDVVSKILNIQR